MFLKIQTFADVKTITSYGHTNMPRTFTVIYSKVRWKRGDFLIYTLYIITVEYDITVQIFHCNDWI